METNSEVYATVQLTKAEAHALTTGWGLAVASLMRLPETAARILMRLDQHRDEDERALISLTKKLDQIQVKQIAELLND